MNIPQIAFLGVFLVLLVAGLLSLLMIVRINWVLHARLRVLDKQPPEQAVIEYELLPSFDQMMWRFWIWDIKKFYPKA